MQGEERVAEELYHKVNKHINDTIHIQDVTVEGKTASKAEFLNIFLDPIKGRKTLGEALFSMQVATQRLQSLGLFHTVNLVLEPVENSQDFRVHTTIKDGKRTTVSIGTSMGTDPGDTGTLEFKGSFKNAFGRGESVSAQILTASTKSNSIQFVFTKPFYKSTSLFTPTLDVNLFQQTNNNTYYSLYNEKVRGLIFKYTLNPHNEVHYEASWRSIIPESNASWSVLNAAGHSLKSSIKHSYFLEGRNDPFVPTDGYAVGAFQELAGLGGNVKFYKGELMGQKAIPLPRDFSLTFHGRTGLLLPLFGDSTHINDRYHIGGASSNTIRGFSTRGVGPRTAKESLGGDLYFLGAIHLLSPIVFDASDGSIPITVRAHTFFNFGNSIQGLPNKNNLKTLFGEEIRSSAGVGAVVKTPFGRVEVNYAMPLRTFGFDKTRRWEIGLIFRY